jgi:hypothetical protein
MAKENEGKAGSKEAAERIAEEHHSLGELLTEVDRTNDLFQLLPLLDQLKQELAEHFKQEESAGGFGKIVSETAPHKANVVDHLFDEHIEFLKTIDGIHADVEELVAGPVADVRAKVATFCSRIRHHEAEENDLLSDALYTDIGGG